MSTPPLSRSTIDARRQILSHLLTWEPLSRTDLARRTGMNKPTVSNLIARMIDEGIVQEIGSGASSGGRKPTLLTVRTESRFAVGVEIDPERIKALLVNLCGEERGSAEVSIDSADAATVTEAIVDLTDRLTLRIDRALLLGCGVAAPGIVDTTNGLVQSRERLAWDDVPLAALLEERLGAAAYVTDRGKAAGLGELWSLGRERPDDFIYLYLGSGVAGALVLGGKLHWGVGGVAGEIGHMTVDPDGPPCSCGNTGCLEALVSTRAILERHSRLEPGGAALAAIGAAAIAGDRMALQTVEETSRWLGIAIGNLVNALNPAVIVLGGPTAEWGEVLIEGITKEMNRRTLRLPRSSVSLVIGRARAMAASLGAAALVLHEAAGLIAQSATIEPARTPVA